MSTRGFVGFVIDGTEKIAYNHHDSYPSGLGLDVLHWLRETLGKDDEDGLVGLGLSIIRAQAGVLRVVAPDSEPTDEDFESLKQYYNPGVGGPSPRPTWYQLLRHTQGNPAAMLKAGVIEDGSAFPLDSLMAEWGYIVDLDAGVLEAYEGFQTAPHSAGRFADRRGQEYHAPTGTYYAAALVGSWPLSELPSDDEFVAACEPVGAEG